MQANKLNSICDKLLDKVASKFVIPLPQPVICFRIQYLFVDSRQNELTYEKRISNQKYFEREETDDLVATYTYGKRLTNLGGQRPPMPMGESNIKYIWAVVITAKVHFLMWPKFFKTL